MNSWNKFFSRKFSPASRRPERRGAVERLEDRIAPATLVGLTTTDLLVTFDSAAPTKLLSSAKITGLADGESMVSIDARPATGGLYGLSNFNKLYTLSPYSGVATAVTGTPAFLLGGKNVGIDFNPTVDRLRVVNDNDLNFRINPNTGAIVDADGNPGNGTDPDTELSYVSGDPGEGRFPIVTDVAYDRNFQGSTQTTLFGIDAKRKTLVRIGSVDGAPSSPNAGEVTTIGALGVSPAANLGFDISVDGTAYLVTKGSLYTLDLGTGAATSVGKIGKGSIKLDGLAVLPHEEIVTAVNASNKLVTFRASDPGVLLTSVPITGLAAGETIAGMDFRTATGELIAITNTNKTVSIDTRTGQAILRGSPPIDAAAFTTAANVGFDFNPVVDRLRLVNANNDNLRYNPVTFTPVDTNTGTAALDPDTDLSFIATDANVGVDPNITGVAYDRNDNNGATATTLFGIDSSLNILVRQGAVDGNAADVAGGGSPNGGLLNTLGSLGVDPTDNVGFDISNTGTNGVGVALAVMQLNGETVSKFFAINLQAGLTNQALGTATVVGTVGGGEVITAMAISPASVQFTATNTIVKEKAGTFAVIEITRTGGADIASSVVFDTLDGTATAGLDYTAVSALTVTFALGETIQRVMVPILGDKLAETHETIRMRISKLAGDTSTNVFGNVTDALITIKGKPLAL